MIASIIFRRTVTAAIAFELGSSNLVKQLKCPLRQNISLYKSSSHTVMRTYSSNSRRAVNKQQQPLENSIIAYNLSDELKIDNIDRLLNNFKEYKINDDLPKDLEEEAIMLSLRRDDKEGSQRRLHDIFLFREGSIVFWGVPYNQQMQFLYGLSSLKVEPYSSDMIREEKEHLIFSLNKSIDRSRMNRDIVQLAVDQDPVALKLDQFAFSHAVTLSVKLGIWEAMLDDYIESIGWVTSDMKKGERLKLTKDQVFRKTGEIYELKHHINLSSDLLDLPDIYWDRHNQEVIFLSVISFLNIKKRTTVINEKLNNCCELMNLLAGHMNDRHHIRLEWMIIVLITVEVLFEVARFF